MSNRYERYLLKHGYTVGTQGMHDYVGRVTDGNYFKILTTFLEMVGKKNARVLDLACGSADYGDMLIQQGVNLYGLDISMEGLRIALNTKATNASSLRLPYKDESFEGVHLKDALVHIPRRIELANEVRRILTEGGVWCVVSSKMQFRLFCLVCLRILEQ